MDDAEKRRLRALEERVAQLEARPAAPPATPATPAGAAGGDALGLLGRLRARLASDGGAIAYAGAIGAGGREYLWTTEHGAHAVTGADPAAVTAVLAGLASPARLALLTALLSGPLGRADLQESLGESTTGHLYHHLRELQAAGLIHQPRRGEYDLVGSAVVPVFAIVAAAADLAVRAGGPPPGEPA